ncbi:phosphopantothenoylcysteine decarboxylase/phosphopantothenate/cysteine ligase [Deinococcus proteolyticus MRP]|uniref:Coenzyme A biosynthesis bifunctional protein CoaBC n=1 Tax=Deinococcus proteolyticus (strain ATCC 35074 / DSM 20540 / JCM 6276 / NBRC 101906 / NCIMB 13154 / VKM Ac-1939 / CCM 2703 / MRP) TaxID=693977 RepID=F0RJZ8_DEIPM|nr:MULTISPECIES: bifunctional phosphopantothenoylcysteine decarboxylase/phosphopantothenate--cysteine ligase CoaBC [Deinococcus]ADY26644.1 phosphopantothenoylcysteine decarboxylase/phosphopantothenate/cysteine ligase [Deinococcus proteolyticus MRP]MCY1702770.1 bifunctional phosphopantothenoylcysteine decarboxylase/phosphopantothenate--cysteine ligase CoaBC [Deinococcus sp. SL84]
MNPPASSSPSPQVLVLVCGSVAAIKAPATLRRLREAGAQVRVVATRAALEFVTPLSLSTAGACEVATDATWFAAQPQAQHLTLARCDAAVVVGATADALARAAHGHADDLLSATLLSVRSPVLWVPAMNERMWQHPAVQANAERLRSFGHHFLGPVFGAFGTAGEGEGLGRMAEPEDIAAGVLRLAQPQEEAQEQDLAGVKVVVSAGPTREYLDPVRFVSNPSSGKMGFAVAQAAAGRGADVTLVSGPVHLATPAGVRRVDIESALDLRDAVLQAAQDADLVVMTAAVADYRAADVKTEKEAKGGETKTIELVKNPDILAELGADKGKRVLVGFAMETHAGVERAADKARRKNADFILLNYPTQEGTAFGGDDNQVTLVRADGTHEAWPRLSKREVAERLLDRAGQLLPAARLDAAGEER